MPHPRRLSRTVRVGDQHGMHLRVCAAVAQLVSQFEAQVEIHRCGQRADARSVLELALLAAESGAELVVSACGRDADRVLNSLGELFESGHQPEPALEFASR